MIGVINAVVGIILLILFLMGAFCNWLVKKKFGKMLLTMKNRDRDKHLLMIEREYRHGYLMDKVERINVFVDKAYYDIKICKIPLYAFEEFTVSAVYFIVILGLAFTVIIAALPNIYTEQGLFNIFFLCIEGFILGFLLMGIRTVFCINSLPEVFKANLCSYLEYELELFDEAERDEEGHLFFHKDYKENRTCKMDCESNAQVIELYGDSSVGLSNGGKLSRERVDDTFSEMDLLQMLEEIMG